MKLEHHPKVVKIVDDYIDTRMLGVLPGRKEYADKIGVTLGTFGRYVMRRRIARGLTFPPLRRNPKKRDYAKEYRAYRNYTPYVRPTKRLSKHFLRGLLENVVRGDILTKEAAEITGATPRSVARWINKFEIVKKVGYDLRPMPDKARKRQEVI